MVLAAGDQRREAADAEFLCGQKIAEGFVLYLRRCECGGKRRAIETRLLGHLGNFIRRRHVASFGVEGAGDARRIGRAILGFSRRAATTARHAGSVS